MRSRRPISIYYFFFFQAEDGIRDLTVTGVQTCALPIVPTTITFFPVDNGDMTLIKFGDLDATTLLIDVNIRQDADDPDGEARDVAKDLRERLKKEIGRAHV